MYLNEELALEKEEVELVNKIAKEENISDCYTHLLPYAVYTEEDEEGGESREVYRKMGIEHLVLSPELTLPKARDIGGGLITYGRIPLMITERCFIKENFGCEKCNSCSLVDRKGEKFPLMRDRDHRNLILNSVPTYMGDRGEELSSHRLYSHHLIFTVEGGEEITNILRCHKDGVALPKRVRRVGRR